MSLTMKQMIVGVTLLLISVTLQARGSPMEPQPAVDLPEPRRTGDFPVEQAIDERRSVREFAPTPLSREEMSQLLWAAQGITDPARGFRSAPSAGATYPIEVDLLITGHEDIEDGVYRYLPREHALEKRLPGDHRRALYDAALRQSFILDAPVLMAISGVVSRTERRYGRRAQRYMHMEAGHVAQNVYLQGTALDIGTVVVGAFREDEVADALQLDPGTEPLYLMPLGRKP